MPIIGFNFTDLQANKKNPIKGKISIKQDLKITEVEKEELNISTPGDTLRFGFEFLVNYSPDIGDIILKGNVLYMDNQKEITKIFNSWKKNNKIEDEQLLLLLLNSIMAKSNIKAFVMAEELGLPPHIKLPRITKGEKKD